MYTQVIQAVLIPFLGTVLGAGCVFFMKDKMKPGLQRGLSGFAAGVMVAASIWSLLIPAMDQSAHLGKLAFAPAVVGFWVGVLFLMALDRLVPHMHLPGGECEGPHCHMARSTMLTMAVALHNLPEGMAVGVVCAGWLAGNQGLTLAGAMALAVGIAIQNFPEGAIISMPLRAEGLSRGRAFRAGVLSGIVEPAGAVLTILLAKYMVPALPYMLAFAAGAMMYVVVEELIPEMAEGGHGHMGTVLFSVGFSLMMVLDVALG